jgi:hypothetical protein
MHFSLRTLLVATTAVAVYVGFHLGMIRTLHGASTLHGPGFLSMLYRLPLFIIWSVAAANIYPRRHQSPHANLVLAAILLGFLGLFVSPFAQIVFLRMGGPNGGSMEFMRWYSAAYVLVGGAVEAICWGLLLYAYAKATATGVARPQSPLS